MTDQIHWVKVAQSPFKMLEQWHIRCNVVPLILTRTATLGGQRGLFLNNMITGFLNILIKCSRKVYRFSLDCEE